jgi:hypothetical protein
MKKDAVKNVTNQKLNRQSKRTFIGAWISADDHATLKAEAKKNNRSISGELRCRLSGAQ